MERIVGQGDDITVAVHGGYAIEEDARQDVRRAVLSRVIEAHSYSSAVGWRDDVAVLVTGRDCFLTSRGFRDGGVEEPDFDDHVLDPRWSRALALIKLADEMYNTSVYERPYPGGMYEVISAWLPKEGSEALLEQARYNLTGAPNSYKSYGKGAEMSIAELARSLHRPA